MSDEEILVPEDLGSNAVATPEPPAQPDQNAPSTGTEQTAEQQVPAEPSDKEAEPAGEEQTEEAGEKKRPPPWFVPKLAKQSDKIAELTRQLQERDARLEALSRSQQPQNGDQQQQPSGPRLYTEEEAKQMADARAAQSAQETEFRQKVEKFDSVGRKEFPDFIDRCNLVASLGANQNPAFMATITDMDDGHKIVAQLADDPEQAIQILQMPPLRMAVALAKLSGQAPKPPPVSKAPAPIRPVAGATRVDPDDSKLSDEAWWEKERKASKG